MDLNTLYIILVALGVLALGFIGVKYLLKNNLLTDDAVNLTNNLLDLSKIIATKSTKDNQDKEKVNRIFNAIKDIINYVSIMGKDKTIAEKEEIAKEQIKAQLLQLNIQLDEEDELLVDILVENFIKFVPKNL